MDLHKPKPIRSWRELLTEVGVIVLSVCIALAAEQAVEWVHWRNQVAEAREMIATEMAVNSASAVSRIRTQVCTDRRLDELAQILDEAARSGSLPPVGTVGIPPRRVWVSGAWESVLASQTATHFPRGELAALADSYTYLQRLLITTPIETTAWSDLAAMTGPGRHLDAASEAELRKALSEARNYSFTMTNLGQQLLMRVKRLNLTYSQDDLDRIKGAMRASPPDVTGTCRPIGPVPPRYGQMLGPVRPAEYFNESLKYLPDLGGR